MLRIAPLALLLFVAAPVCRAGDLTLPAPESTVADLEYVEPFLAKDAHCAAVCDHARLLAVGHRSGKGPNLSLFRLDDQGQPGEPVSVSFPVVAALKDRPRQALSLVFHPKLPLLYVWCDVPPLDPVPKEDPAAKDLDHLLIYSVEGKEPKLLQALAKGEDFAAGVTDGAIALDAAGKRLYVPNLRGRVKEPKAQEYFAVGWMTLDAKGLPPTPAPLTFSPLLSHFSAYPAGMGFVPVSDNVVIVSGNYGPATWDEGNRRARFNHIFLHPSNPAVSVYRLGGHPSLPVVYSSTGRLALLFALEHAEGYLTLAPQRVTMPEAPMHSYPVVVSKRGVLAVGGANRVHVVALDKNGRIKGDRIDLAVQSPTVEALAYSEKYDKLYVPVEKLP